VTRELGASDGWIYLLGQYNSLTEDSDQPRPWKQRRYFYYCSGVDIPDCCLVYRIQHDELLLYIPKIKPKAVVWMGRPPTIEEAKAR
jgi:Xaa-Pro dipeptidase